MSARGHIDEIQYVDPLARKLDRAGTGQIPEGSSVYVRGWAFLTDPPRAAAAALSTIDDAEPLELVYNQPRPDVVNVLGLPPILPIGFHGVRSLSDVARGRHVLRVTLVDRATQASYDIDSTVTFEIVDGTLAFPATQRLRRGEMTVAVDAFTATGTRDGKDALERPVDRGAVVIVRGWAVDRRFTTAASDVYACIDGSTFVRGIIGMTRNDVAGSLGMQAVARCGFIVRIATSGLAAGDHVVEMRAIAADGERYAASEPFPFVVA